ncbi:zinc finger protein 99 [Musca domestica]|uniref:Zinc finger protein 99 n=1 Tax=Musca domestica TaxID=7370 RepID=A0A9J7I3Q8_MUSDO|nr:zinc finger protein 99 [Musca domestica]
MVKSCNNKCGEVYYRTIPEFGLSISCVICDDSISFEEFSEHFQSLHLPKKEVNNIGQGPIIIKKEAGILNEDEKIILHEEFFAEPVNPVDPLSGDGKNETCGNLSNEDDNDDKPLQYIINRSKAVRNQKDLDSKHEDGQGETKVFTNNDNSQEDDDDDYEWPDETDVHDNNDGDTKGEPLKDLPFKCQLCPRSYAIKRSLQKHKHSAHNPNKAKRKAATKLQYKCEECEEVFRTEAMLRNHKYKHTGIFCDICQKPFRQIGTMLQHKIRHTGIKQHKCDKCPREFFTDKELKSHMISHVGMPFVCELCGKRCRDRGVLTAHMRRHTGERPAKCSVCGKCFFSAYDLSIHAVGHSNERPYPCEICTSRFGTKKALRVHRRIHAKKQTGGSGEEFPNEKLMIVNQETGSVDIKITI